MKSLTSKVLLATALALFIVLLPFVEAAVIVTETDSLTFESLKVTNTVSWVARFQDGGVSGQYPDSYSEIILTVGNTKSYSQHVWAYPEPIEISRGSLGNVYATAGSDVLNVTPTLPFNMILIRVVDSGTPFGDVSFEGGIYVINNEKKADIPNVLVNNASRYFKMDLGETNPIFEINGKFDAFFTGSTNGFIDFTAIQIIPEPSSGIIIALLSMICITFRRR